MISYVHLHDNHGEEDEHLALGAGEIPLVDVCYALTRFSPRAIWAIECQPAGWKQSIQWLREYGFMR